MHLRHAAIFLCALCVGVAAFAATLDESLIQTSGLPSVGSGKFYGYQTPAAGPGSGAFSNAYNKAVSEGVPLVVIWSNDDCVHCNDFTGELNANKADVSVWLASREAVFVFFKDHLNDSSGRNAAYQSDHASGVCYEAWSFAANTCSAKASWPLFAFYYKRSDGREVVWGTPLDRNGLTRTWSQFKKWYEEWTAANGINEKIGGGKFAVSDTEFDRYEAEPSTEYVDVELVRDVERSFSGGRDLLVTVYPGEDGLCLTNAVEWAASETSKVVRIAVVPPGGHYTEGTTNTLVILDKEGEAGETAHIVCRGTVENSNNNPLWLGERTPDDLAWGEWTVDLDVATNKVAAAEGEAYTIVSVQGSLWCPDCANTDANFLDLVDGDGENRFRKWAESNHVALAVVDIPNFSAKNGAGPENCASPSMFSKTAYLSRGAMRSGRPYLSRKMVPDDEAAKMRAKNHFLVSTNTDAGGYHRPEDTNVYRTGVPIFVLLRKDGTVAARLIRFAAKSPGASDQAKWSDYIARFDEMLSIVSDKAEIGNNHQSTTAASLTPWSPVSASLSHVDTQDFVLLPDASAGSHIKLSLSSESTNAVTLAIVSESGQTLASKYGPIGGLVLEADIATADDRWFAKVSCGNTATGFAVDETASTVAAYELSMESYIQPQEKSETSVPSGDSVTFRVVSGEPYRFAGLVLPVDGLEPVGGDDGLYRATVSGDISINVENGAKSVTYQLWHPGTVEFTRSAQDVYTHMGDATIKVGRIGGVSGAMTEFVRLVSVDDLTIGRYVWAGDASVSWEDGESGEKTVTLGTIPPGSVMHAPGVLVFEVCKSRLAVTLLDKDAPGLEFLDYDEGAYRYFSSGISFGTINLLSGNHVSVRVLSGSVPQGTRLVYDGESGKVELLGEPASEGDYEFAVALAEIRDGRYVVGPASTIRVRVDPTDELNTYLTKARSSETLPLYMDRDGTNIIAGTLSVAITSHGRISARYVGTEARTVAFSGAWQKLNEENKAYARLVKGDCILDLALDANGVLYAELRVSPEYSCFAGPEGLALNATASWPKEDSLDEYVGIYNVALPVDSRSRQDAPCGMGILTLRMSPGTAAQAGRFTYSGFMPDGTPLNGSMTAVRTAEYGREFVRLPIFRRVGRNIFSATLTIDPEAALKWDSPDDPLKREIVHLADGTAALTVHRDAAWEYEVLHGMAVGSYYLPGVSPLELSEMFYTNLYARPIIHKLRFASNGVQSPVFGEISLPWVDVEPSAVALSPAVPVKGLTFSFKTRTGMFSGSAVVTFTDESGKKKKVTGSYRGVLTPGWVRNCDCGDMVPEWYFGSGFLRYRDFNSDGRAVMKSLPVTLDPPER